MEDWKPIFIKARRQGFILNVVDVRIPKYNELYIDKNGYVHRCKERVRAGRAHIRTILKESWV